MPVEHQCLQRKQQRANTQPRRVYDAHCVYHMQKDAVPKTQSFVRFKSVMVVCIGVGNATASRRNAIRLASIDRL